MRMSTKKKDCNALREAAKEHVEQFGYPVALCVFVDWINSDDPDAYDFDTKEVRDALRRLPEDEATRAFEDICTADPINTGGGR